MARPSGIGPYTRGMERRISSRALIGIGALISALTIVQQPVSAQPAEPLASRSASSVPFDVKIDGGPTSLNTEQSAVFIFIATAGQTFSVNANRPWSGEDPLGRGFGDSDVITATSSGRYLLFLDAAATAPATVTLTTVSPSPIIITVNPGNPMTFRSSELRDQQGRVRLKAGQRYRLSVPKGQTDATFCAGDWSGPAITSYGCVSGSTRDEADPFVAFIANDSTDAVVTANLDSTRGPLTATATISEAPNDEILDVSKDPIVQRAPLPGQSLVVPFWGTPAERAVVSSPVEANVAPWGQPWIDREVIGTDRVKVAATPVVFKPTFAPFVSWTGPTAPNSAPNTQRFGVYRGEDNAVAVTTDGKEVTVRNSPWFASIASMQLEPGARYALQIIGNNVRPLSLALRDPSGKFSSNLSPWQWTADGPDQRALTTFTADRAGGWALEMRPSGNRVHDLRVSITRIGGGGGFEGVVDVDDVLTVGEKTDVQLGPNEFARFTVKLTVPTAQLIQPDVLRYRNTTFQPTAADLSLWDSRGRLVWANNRNLEEEVLSGRLGKEPQLEEKFATVASADAYTLIVDPHTDISGRFRISVTSSPVKSDVALGNGPVPLVPGGTLTGVVEVRTPTKYRLTGAKACITATSTADWAISSTGAVPAPAPAASVEPVVPTTAPPAVQATPAPAAVAAAGGRCVENGRTIALPVGVHRFTFTEPLTKPATFAALPDGAAADQLRTINAAVGSTVSVPADSRGSAIAVNLPDAGGRYLVLGSDGAFVSATLEHADGSRTLASGLFVTRAAGPQRLLFGPTPQPFTVTVVRAPAEVATGSLAVGARQRVFSIASGQRLELAVTVSRRPGVRLEIVPTTDAAGRATGSAQLLYVENTKRQRFEIDGDRLLIAPGQYRFVFEGFGKVRVTLAQLRATDAKLVIIDG